MLLVGRLAAASSTIPPFLTSLVEAVLFIESVFDFLVGGGFSSSEDAESDPESELEETSELAFRFMFSMRPLRVGFGGLTFPPEDPFSSSASLSELVLEEDPDEIEAFFSFLLGFAVCLVFLAFWSESLPSLLPLLDVSSWIAFLDALTPLSLELSKSSSSLALDGVSDSTFC